MLHSSCSEPLTLESGWTSIPLKNTTMHENNRAVQPTVIELENSILFKSEKSCKLCCCFGFHKLWPSITLDYIEANFFLFNSWFVEMNTSSVESQKGVNGGQRCSIEHQKGAIAVQSLWRYSALLVLNGTSLNIDSALLALN